MVNAIANFDAVANIEVAGLGACFSVGEPLSHDWGRRRKHEGLTRSSLRRQQSAQHAAEEDIKCGTLTASTARAWDHDRDGCASTGTRLRVRRRSARSRRRRELRDVWQAEN